MNRVSYKKKHVAFVLGYQQRDGRIILGNICSSILMERSLSLSVAGIVEDEERKTTRNDWQQEWFTKNSMTLTSAVHVYFEFSFGFPLNVKSLSSKELYL